MSDATDWKAIALELARRVNFAVSHLNAKGSGLVGSIHEPSENWKPWRDYMADALEMIPGVTVDRELMRLNDLPYSKQAKARKQIMEKRAALEETK